jgi:hypothetical protein
MKTSAQSHQAFTGFKPDRDAWTAALPAHVALVAVELQSIGRAAPGGATLTIRH